MDVNGTRFQLLLGRDDWANCSEIDETARPPAMKRLGQSWPCADMQTGTAWDADRAELNLRPLLFQFPPLEGGAWPAQEKRRGAARDRAGWWYWIDETGTELLVQKTNQAAAEHFWSSDDDGNPHATTSPGDFRPVTARPLPRKLHLGGLTITEDQYLVAGVLEPAGLLVFDLLASEPPRQLLWPRAVHFEPYDMAPRSGGGLWILDRKHARYWALDRYFNVQEQQQPEVSLAPARVDVFQPVGQEEKREMPAQSFPEGISLNATSSLTTQHPVAIESLADDTVLILETDPHTAFSRIYHYRFGQQVGQPLELDVVLGLVASRESFHLRAHDFALVPLASSGSHVSAHGVLGRLYLINEEGNQCYAFTLTQRNQQLTLEAVPAFFPLHLFGGRGIVATDQGVFYDSYGTWFPLIEQFRPRFATDATIFLLLAASDPPNSVTAIANEQSQEHPIFDGHAPGCVWHRLLLDACIPPETSVTIWSRASDESKDLVDPNWPDWQPEPSLYRRSDGSELPFAPRVSAQEQREGYGTWELLLQKARGRYLQLKFVLSGNGRTTPRLRALRAYYPRFSYLDHYLPAAYREDAQSASFVERFLANVEGFFTTFEDKIDAVPLLFDPRSAPPETLDWLASWFGIALDMAWNERKKRLFIKHAMEFFRYRGTLHGLLVALQLAFEENPAEAVFTRRHDKHPYGGIQIVEGFRTRRTPEIFASPADNGHTASRDDQPARWFPAQRGERLNQLYRAFLQKHTIPVESTDTFPLTAPTDPLLEEAWRHFSLETLGFTPLASDADLPLWQSFLSRRYQRITLLNAAHQAHYASFGQVRLFTHLSQNDRACDDWYRFEGFVVQMHHTAHQFTVLLPLSGNSHSDDLRRQRNLVLRVLDIEKPAHTSFDIQFYVAAFRVGITQLGWGSRTALMPSPLRLGDGTLSEGYLANENTRGMSEGFGPYSDYANGPHAVSLAQFGKEGYLLGHQQLK